MCCRHNGSDFVSSHPVAVRSVILDVLTRTHIAAPLSDVRSTVGLMNGGRSPNDVRLGC